MRIREKNEQKRSKMWKLTITISALVIIIVLGYILHGIFSGNPIEGNWYNEEKGYGLEIEDDNEMTVTGIFDGQEMEIELEYSLKKADKLITIKADEDAYSYVSNIWTTEETSETAGKTSVTLSYSLGRKTLTLSDRDYGVEFVFTRK